MREKLCLQFRYSSSRCNLCSYDAIEFQVLCSSLRRNNHETILRLSSYPNGKTVSERRRLVLYTRSTTRIAYGILAYRKDTRITYRPPCPAMPVTADHDRPQKRQRVTQACQRCRGRKLRCDSGSPSCGACLAAQATCSYDTTSGRQRGLKSGYVKVLESLWGSVFQNVPGSERVVSHLLASLPANAESAVDEPSVGGDNTSPLERWRASSIPKSIRALLDGRPIPILDGTGVTNTTWNVPSPAGVDSVEQHDHHAHALPTTSSLNGAEQYDLDAPPLPSSPTRAPNASFSLVSGLPDLPQDWQTLVQIYLCTEYCCLPIFEKACPYRWAYKYQDHASINLCDLESSCRGQYASLWAVLILGELHLHGVKSARLEQIKHSAKILLATAESGGPGQTFSYAFLLWSLVYTGSCSFTLAKMMLAQAMVLADVRDKSLDAQGGGAEALVQAGCFVVETILAIATGAQTSIIAVDADAFPSSDVGEWDPFINVLGQGRTTTASNVSPQLPPSRTGSTFRALVKLMAILRGTRTNCSDPEMLVEELQAWEASLPTDLRGAVIAGATLLRTPVPSQLNLRSWYGTLHGMISRIREGATGTASNGNPSGLALQEVDALHVTDQAYDLNMLPATSSVLLLQIPQISAATSSSPDAMTVACSHLATKFMNHWGWMDANRCVQQDLAGTVAQGRNHNTHQSTIAPSLTEGSASGTVGLECQDPSLGHSQYHANAAAELAIQPGCPTVGDVNGMQPLSQWRSNNEASLPSADTATAANVYSCMEDPASYDLLEYLTMFENNDGYVGERRSFSPSPLHVHRLITNTVTTRSIWNLSGSSAGFTILLKDVSLSLISERPYETTITNIYASCFQ